MKQPTDTQRLNALLELYEGCKWRDAGPLSSLKPEDEKYISKQTLLDTLDFFIINHKGYEIDHTA